MIRAENWASPNSKNSETREWTVMLLTFFYFFFILPERSWPHWYFQKELVLLLIMDGLNPCTQILSSSFWQRDASSSSPDLGRCSNLRPWAGGGFSDSLQSVCKLHSCHPIWNPNISSSSWRSIFIPKSEIGKLVSFSNKLFKGVQLEGAFKWWGTVWMQLLGVPQL